MILSCPLCNTRYLVSAKLFAFGARTVRCARCSHSWKADLPPQVHAITPPPDIDLTPPPETTAPIPKGSNLPVIRKRTMSPHLTFITKVSAIACGVLFIAALLVFHQFFAQIFPVLERPYNAMGFHIYHYGHGLSLDKVRSELMYEGGMTKLLVEGKIRNKTPYVQEIPPIKVDAIGADGQIIQSWQIDPPASRVFDGEGVTFRSSINAPQGNVTEINLSFVEIKHGERH